MQTATESGAVQADAKVVPLPLSTGRKQTPRVRDRFRIVPFVNSGGSQSWRVTGTDRQGKQVRENFSDLKAAQCRQVELTADWLGRQGDDASLRATRLSEKQIRIAETAFVRLDTDEEMLLAVEAWRRDGKHNVIAESPRIDEAVRQFKEWLTGSTLRDHTKRNLRLRIDVFANSIGNLRVSDITPDEIEQFLAKRNVSARTKDNHRRCVSRFFSWCMEHKRRWTKVNPCSAVRVEQGERPPPAILTVDECGDMLKASAPRGLAPYVAVGLFAGLRPFEALRLKWDAVNLKDREIRLEGIHTKTGRARVVAVCDTLYAWLKAYEGKPFFPSNWRKKFDAVKAQAGYGGRSKGAPELKPWPVDVMRHTAISHYFRHTGSYGQTAEQFGNSEAIIKSHYQGRVSSEDTKKFYALRPKKGARK